MLPFVICRAIHDTRTIRHQIRQAFPLVELFQICANRRIQNSGFLWSFEESCATLLQFFFFFNNNIGIQASLYVF
jgi:hypothetical protein